MVRQRTPIKQVTNLDTRNDFKKAVDQMMRDLTTQFELVSAQAKIAKHQKDALIKEGFTSEEAMQILLTYPSWK